MPEGKNHAIVTLIDECTNALMVPIHTPFSMQIDVEQTLKAETTIYDSKFATLGPNRSISLLLCYVIEEVKGKNSRNEDDSHRIFAVIRTMIAECLVWSILVFLFNATEGIGDDMYLKMCSQKFIVL